MMAIAYILANPDNDVIMISTVDGNVSREKVTNNVKKILKLMNKKIPIYEGSANPTIKSYSNEESYHLEDGLGDIEEIKNFDASEIIIEKESSILKIIENICKYPNQINLFLIGPLTNIASCYLLYTEIVNLVKKVYIMGGSYLSRGNLNPAGEFNFGYDFIAAKIVLSNFKKLIIIPWEPTEFLLLKPHHHQAVPKMISNKNKTINDLLHSFSSLIVDKYHIKNQGIQFCDLYAAMSIFYKKCVKKFSLSNLEVIIDSPNLSGMTHVKNRREIKQDFENFLKNEKENIINNYHVIVEEMHEDLIYDHYDTPFHLNL
jgi:inosine-uridine nucleoside N-ribohydrolase